MFSIQRVPSGFAVMRVVHPFWMITTTRRSWLISQTRLPLLFLTSSIALTSNPGQSCVHGLVSPYIKQNSIRENFYKIEAFIFWWKIL